MSERREGLGRGVTTLLRNQKEFKDYQDYKFSKNMSKSSFQPSETEKLQTSQHWNLVFSHNPEKVLIDIFQALRLLRKLYAQNECLRLLRIECFERNENSALDFSNICEIQKCENDIPFHQLFQHYATQLLIASAFDVSKQQEEKLLGLSPRKLLQQIKTKLPDNSGCLDLIKSLLTGKKAFKPQHLPQDLDLWTRKSYYFQKMEESRNAARDSDEEIEESDEVLHPQIGERQKNSQEELKQEDHPNQEFIGRYDLQTKTKRGLGVLYPHDSAIKKATGVWSYDELNGPCLFEFNSDNIDFFMGESEKNEPVKGFMQLKNGARYYGSFKNGLPDGEGLFQSADQKTSYSGMFKEGRFHGTGQMLDCEKQVSVKAEWENEKVKRIVDEEEEEKAKELEKQKMLEMEEMMTMNQFLGDGMPLDQLIDEKIRKFKKKGKQGKRSISRDHKSREQLQQLMELKMMVEGGGLFKGQRGGRGSGLAKHMKDFFH